ncbi:5'-3' DNA helicase ZGRF1-like isoform X2 [Dysidea avara]|uniref:5'-3' DNA helicase ZGRF1-like isoform X2 n=1 Tax=Dysidea avara TaxID=196820 RepID=UPI00332A5FE0
MLAQYKVLYTHQKTKKHKTWKDGILRVYQSKATLLDASGSHDHLDTLYIRSSQVEAGQELESDRYIIDVDQLEDVRRAPTTPVHVVSTSSDHKNVTSSTHMVPRRSGVDIIKLLKMTSPGDHVIQSSSHVTSFDVTATPPSSQSGSLFPMFGVRSNVKRSRSLDVPCNAANHIQPVHAQLTSFDSDPINEKENISFVGDNIFWDEQDSNGYHDDELVRQLPPAPPSIQQTGSHGNIIRKDQRPKSIRRNIELFNSPYISSDKGLPHESASSKKRKVSSSVAMVTPKSGNKLPIVIPSLEECHQLPATPLRDHVIPSCFPSVAAYRDCLCAALTEHINLIVYDVINRWHQIISKVDCSGLRLAGVTMTTTEVETSSSNNAAPCCKHGPAQLRTVRKEGANKGRLFYTCSQPIAVGDQCKFFKWADEVTSSSNSCHGGQHTSQIKLKSTSDLIGYSVANGIQVYPDCELIGRSQHIQMTTHNKYKKTGGAAATQVLYLVLPRQESSKAYNKDDLWIVSHDAQFTPTNSFVARSTFYGPTSSLHLEVCPISGYSPSNWPSGVRVVALHLSNVSTELCCLDNQCEHLRTNSFPLLPHLISLDGCHSNSGQFTTPFLTSNHGNNTHLHWNEIEPLVTTISQQYHLNEDQHHSLCCCARMFTVDQPPVTLIHGVFGSGKSYLLSVIVIFLTELFPLLEEQATSHISSSSSSHTPCLKLLVSSATNVAVDRVLMGLLELGYTDLIRVGSMKKIAKPVLPYSVHMSGDDQELAELQDMYRQPDLTSVEKKLVAESIKKHKMGINKKRLSEVRVVGATCAACLFDVMKSHQFNVVLVDEASQMSEPVSLLPIARFGCHKLLLLGDPKQLPPTIQGSEASHDHGLEQTLFDRLVLMGHTPIMLKTQYRCHPRLSSLSNKLFYGGQLVDGVSESDRIPVKASLPTLCFCDVVGGREQCDQDGSFSNPQEAQFVVMLIELCVQWGVPLENVGVIVLYRSQVGMIKNKLTNHKQLTSHSVLISTVDAFQGGERDVIILSCVRTRHAGFIDSDRRVNVALTRAKRHLLIVGNRHMLQSNPLWGRIINYCNEHDDGVMDHRQFMINVNDDDNQDN